MCHKQLFECQHTCSARYMHIVNVMSCNERKGFLLQLVMRNRVGPSTFEASSLVATEGSCYNDSKFKI